MSNFVFRKFQSLGNFSADDEARLNASMQRVERIRPHTDLVQEGVHARYLNIVLEGWACRYKHLEDGRRQIIALFVPGDMCDPCVFTLDAMSHIIGTLTPVTLGRIAEKDMLEITRTSPSLSKAFWLEMLVSAEIQREWTVNLGRRTALERLAHLFCELLLRMRAVGLTKGCECDLPITQADLGDVLGLSPVHVNRTLQEIRAMGLVEVRGKRLVVHDEPALQALGLFNPNYLHLLPSPSQKG
ncbi:Crp/Fnr family transcriptional regulator [Lichenihabitans sp. Uapishka_5]|uniref:Crp/Fnr family transcriptional regulator n=1 Tax=Lichenihabitans sp. Uapishka_5 TaxID=3037302 RepID=UPI0029E7FB53|nr:Crp/Fnr family transcriptional regulator [Lichenihabitans sp. Uapishka_5]MDX7950231.1 Crp/Fnr family transcriptional regulator [Lichenihabitans sp. Uapishka_5]